MNKIKNLLSENKIAAVLSCAAIILLLAVGAVVLKPQNNANLLVNVAPTDAKIVIAGQAYGNGMLRNMAPGHYVADIMKDGFESKTIEFDLKNDEVVFVNEYLIQPDLGFDYYETDSGSLLVLREYAEAHEDDAELKSFLENYEKKRTIVNILPLEYKDEITGGFYKVDYMEKNLACKKNYCITISTNDDIYTEAAFAAIKAHGYDLNDYTIIDLSDRCD